MMDKAAKKQQRPITDRTPQNIIKRPLKLPPMKPIRREKDR